MNAPTARERQCPWCRAPVHPQVRVCPHCAHWQGRPALWTYRGFLSGIVPALIFATVIGSNYVMFSALASGLFSVFQPKPLTGELHVVDSTMAQGRSEGRPVIAVVGRLGNGAAHAWESVTLEVQFFDAAGRLIDVGRASPGCTVPPRGGSAFCVLIAPELPRERYAGHKVFVRSASKPEWPF